MALDGAYISTIHAFCKRILTEFFYVAGIDAAFGIIDEDEQRLLKAESLETMLEAAWQDQHLAQALRILFEGRRIQPGTRSFVDLIIPLSDFLDSVADREAFYQRANRINDAGDKAYADLLAAQSRIIAEQLAMMRQRLDYALALDKHYCQSEFISKTIQENYIPVIDQCIKLVNDGQLPQCAAYIKSLKFDNFPRRANRLDEDIKEIVKAPAQKVKEDLKALSQFAALNPDFERQLAGRSACKAACCSNCQTRAEYTKTKTERNVLDFADLEHYMLRLLENQPAVAETLRGRFEFVFVDEYQDINTVQQRILDTLGRGNNVFAVGDIKQSIYGFRQSRPEIFLDRLRQAAIRPDEKTTPLRVDLAENFRSRPEVLEFVNAVFRRIMTEGTASMRYDKQAELKAEFKYPPFTAAGERTHPVELILLDQDVDDNLPDQNSEYSADEDNDDTNADISRN